MNVLCIVTPIVAPSKWSGKRLADSRLLSNVPKLTTADVAFCTPGEDQYGFERNICKHSILETYIRSYDRRDLLCIQVCDISQYYVEKAVPKKEPINDTLL